MPVVIGVDAHKYGWVAVAVDETGRRVDACVTEATPIGAQQCQEWASALDVAGGVRRWGIEGAMHYGRALAQHLIRHGAVVVEVPGSATAAERRRSRGREAEKSDVTDALAIARVTLRDGDRLPAIAVDGAPARCHVLSEHRDNLILARTAALNQLYAHVTHTHPAAPRYAFQARRNRPWLRELAAAKPSASTSLTQARTMIVGQLAAMVLMYDEMIRALDQELRVLADQLAPALLSIHGVGPLCAAKLVGIIHHIDRFPTAARFAAYAGVAPLEASSGDRRRHRLSRRGNRQLNHVLHVVAVVQRRGFAPAQAYLAKKTREGKSSKEALRALKRQLANVVFRALQRDAITTMLQAAGRSGIDIEAFN